MSRIFNDITELIGSTPLMSLKRFAPGVRLAAKLERTNPTGSAKDRAALSMIRAAEADGSLAPGGMIIEFPMQHRRADLTFDTALEDLSSRFTEITGFGMEDSDGK